MKVTTTPLGRTSTVKLPLLNTKLNTLQQFVEPVHYTLHGDNSEALREDTQRSTISARVTGY